MFVINKYTCGKFYALFNENTGKSSLILGIEEGFYWSALQFASQFTPSAFIQHIKRTDMFYETFPGDKYHHIWSFKMWDEVFHPALISLKNNKPIGEVEILYQQINFIGTCTTSCACSNRRRV